MQRGQSEPSAWSPRGVPWQETEKLPHGIAPGFSEITLRILYHQASAGFRRPKTLRSTAYEKLLPPLVAKSPGGGHGLARQRLRRAPRRPRATLLRWWFETDHLIEQADGTLSPFRYYFAQREAVETVIWLYDVRGARDKFDLLRFDASGAVSSEHVRRGLAALRREDGDRRGQDQGPVAADRLELLPQALRAGFRRWRATSCSSRPTSSCSTACARTSTACESSSTIRSCRTTAMTGATGATTFRSTLHIQDDVRIVRADRQHLPHQHPPRLSRRRAASRRSRTTTCATTSSRRSAPKPVGKTTDSKTDLGEIVREIDELAVFNDEAHHIHDPRMAWFKSIQDIHHRMLQKDRRLAFRWT